MVLVGAERSPVNNGIGTSVQVCVHAACAGEISHILFWRLGSRETEGERKKKVYLNVCVHV